MPVREVLTLQLRTGPIGSAAEAVLGFPPRRSCRAAADHPRASPVVPRAGAAQSRGTVGLFDGLLGLLSHDVGIDLGTANTLVTVRHRGIVISEPSVVAMDTRSKRVLAIGAEAKRMVGRTPANIVAIRPLRDGVISDFDVTEQMIRYFIAKVHERFAQIRRPRVLVGIPSGVTEVEKRAVRDATVNAGARWARLIEEPMAAAIGAGLPVSEPSGSLIVDIGGGTTEVAVISLGDRGQPQRARRRRRDGHRHRRLCAARVQPADGRADGGGDQDRGRSAYPVEGSTRTVTFRGRDLLTGLPSASKWAATRSGSPGADGGRDHRRHQGDDRGDAAGAGGRHHGPGIVLAGGGALLAGLDKRVAEATQMPVHIADDPLTCVVRGPGACSKTWTRWSACWSASSSPARRARQRGAIGPHR